MWSILKTFRAGSTDRPALQQLLADDVAHRIHIGHPLYKVDRLTRSLADFAKLVELFDAHGVSFVSVTQQLTPPHRWAIDAKRAFVLCAVRAGGHLQAHSRQKLLPLMKAVGCSSRAWVSK